MCLFQFCVAGFAFYPFSVRVGSEYVAHHRGLLCRQEYTSDKRKRRDKPPLEQAGKIGLCLELVLL